MVPTLKVPKDALKENGFINGYVKDGSREVQYENCIYLLFKPEDLDMFRDFLDDEYERTKDLIDDYDYEGGYVVVVYQLDPKHKNDFKLIKEGKYSKTSKQFQEIFPKIIKILKEGLHKDEISLQYRIFNKTEDLKLYWEEKIGVELDEDMEIWQGWIEEKEILHPKILEHV